MKKRELKLLLFDERRMKSADMLVTHMYNLACPPQFVVGRPLVTA